MLPSQTMVVFPVDPGEPVIETPVVYSLAPELSEVAESLRVLLAFDESVWSKT